MALGGETFGVTSSECTLCGTEGEATLFLSSSGSSSPSEELLSESSLPSDSVAECFECSELFDFEGEGEREPDWELDCEEDEEDWEEVDEDLLRVFGDGARRHGSTHWSPDWPNLVVVLVT